MSSSDSPQPPARVEQLRQRLIELAQRQFRMPIGTDLVLHEQDDPQAVLHDGQALGQVMIDATRRYESPLVLPIMDLTLEKADLLRRLGLGGDDPQTFHFDQAPDQAMIQRAEQSADDPFDQRGMANIASITYVKDHAPDLVACGMAIGPFSLMTKLLSDPIMPVAMAGMGMTGQDDMEVLLAERALALAELSVARSLKAQIEAGAQAVCVCEPAANVVYLSPNQIEQGADIFERFVMAPNRRVRDQLHDAGVGLILHDCGELIDPMVSAFGHDIKPVMLSLGSSCDLAHCATLVPDDVVLYGNLPSKKFYSDSECSLEQVEKMTCRLSQSMRDSGQPFILGTECDVLSVTGKHDAIVEKVHRMLTCRCS